MDAFSPIRKGKIQEIKNKVSRNLYDTKELREGMANRLLQSENLKNIVRELVLSKNQEKKSDSDSNQARKRSRKTNSCIREKKIKEAKEKNRRGYYNRPEVFSKIAQRLIDSLEI